MRQTPPMVTRTIKQPVNLLRSRRDRKSTRLNSSHVSLHDALPISTDAPGAMKSPLPEADISIQEIVIACEVHTKFPIHHKICAVNGMASDYQHAPNPTNGHQDNKTASKFTKV